MDRQTDSRPLLSQLTEDELRIWITVLNHGEAPSDEDLEEVIETLRTIGEPSPILAA
eukprot:COSAG04_NODE_14759_length_556_cov_0.774617_1_plen_56_part_01